MTILGRYSVLMVMLVAVVGCVGGGSSADTTESLLPILTTTVVPPEAVATSLAQESIEVEGTTTSSTAAISGSPDRVITASGEDLTLLMGGDGTALNWTTRAIPEELVNSPLHGFPQLYFDNGFFYLIDMFDNNVVARVARTTDGVTWTVVDVDANPPRAGQRGFWSFEDDVHDGSLYRVRSDGEAIVRIDLNTGDTEEFELSGQPSFKGEIDAELSVGPTGGLALIGSTPNLIWESEDLRTWTATERPWPTSSVYETEASPSALYVVNSGSVWTKPAGGEWSPTVDELQIPGGQGTQLRAFGDRILAAEADAFTNPPFEDRRFLGWLDSGSFASITVTLPEINIPEGETRTASQIHTGPAGIFTIYNYEGNGWDQTFIYEYSQTGETWWRGTLTSEGFPYPTAIGANRIMVLSVENAGHLRSIHVGTPPTP